MFDGGTLLEVQYTSSDFELIECLQPRSCGVGRCVSLRSPGGLYAYYDAPDDSDDIILLGAIQSGTNFCSRASFCMMPGLELHSWIPTRTDAVAFRSNLGTDKLTYRYINMSGSLGPMELSGKHQPCSYMYGRRRPRHVAQNTAQCAVHRIG